MPPLGETPSQTVGPYLSLGLPWAEGPVADVDGVRVSGRVLDGAGEPIGDALVETWQSDPPAFARCASDDEGR
jgi:protocatechuate 3,4-dioxygenase, alpha subunit